MDIIRSIQKKLTFGLSSEQEDHFRKTNFDTDITQARIFVILVLLPFVALIFNDYGFFGLSRTFYRLLALRLAFAACTILFLKGLREFSNYRTYDRAELLWGLFLAIANTAINATRPENFVAHTIVTVLAVFVMVLAIPNRFTNQLILALAYTIGQMLIIVPSLWTSSQASFTVLLSLVMANAIAIASSWLLHFWRRREFLIHEEIQNARAEAELQLIERKKAEDALRESEALLSAFLERLPVGVGLFDPQGRWLVSNSLLRNLMSDVIPSHDPENSWRWRTWGADGHVLDRSEWPGARALQCEKVTPGMDFLYTYDNGREVWMRVSSVPFRNDPGEITGVITVIQDVDKQKRTEEALRASEARYRSFIENFKGIAFEANEKFIPVFLHGTVEEITGYTEEEFMSKQPWKEIIHPEDLPHIYEEEEKVRNSPYKASGEIDFRIIRRDGKIKWVHEIYQKIPESDGNPDKYQGAIYDITERKEAEETLAKIDIARQKEIHHRIKNNLQVISSLLDLAAERFSNRECVQDSEVLKAFRESQDRVISMALIHEELYKGEGFETLNFSPYIEELTESLFQTYRLTNTDISLNMDLEENIFLNMDIAVPLGIIVNELVSNSLKHAFKGKDQGEIRIKLHREENIDCINSLDNNKVICKSTGFALTVSDNGVGIPENFEIENLDSLGLQLVASLVDQLDGEFELRRNNGTEFIIRFTVSKKNNQASAAAAQMLTE